MFNLEEVTKKAAETILFEDKELLPMIEINIKAKQEDSQSYSIRVPKAFVEEIYRMGIKEGKRDIFTSHRPLR